ncbi:MAG: hypothetical protein PVJ16_08250 [Nitrosopumilaceae archaeon]
MNKHTIIVIFASIIIIGSMAYSGWNIFAAHQIQIKAINEGYFSFFDLLNNGRILACNPLPLDASFKEMRISVAYVNENIGSINYPNLVLNSNSESVQKGKLETDNPEQTQYLALHFDAIYNKVIPTRIDLENIAINVETDSQILGIIPHTTIKQYPGLEFWFLMDNQDKNYKC